MAARRRDGNVVFDFRSPDALSAVLCIRAEKQYDIPQSVPPETKQEGNGQWPYRSACIWPLHYLYFCKMSGETCTIPRSEILYFLQNVGESCTIPQIEMPYFLQNVRESCTIPQIDKMLEEYHRSSDI